MRRWLVEDTASGAATRRRCCVWSQSCHCCLRRRCCCYCSSRCRTDDRLGRKDGGRGVGREGGLHGTLPRECFREPSYAGRPVCTAVRSITPGQIANISLQLATLRRCTCATAVEQRITPGAGDRDSDSSCFRGGSIVEGLERRFDRERAEDHNLRGVN